MKGEKIEIVKATDEGDEGEAIIRLLDVFELPGEPVFRIEPLDDDAGLEDTPGWPSGDLEALRMRVGEKGVELIVSADVIDTPALLPGTPVAISVPSASIREELRWPGLRPAVRTARRGIVVVSAEKRRAEIAARAKARRAELESMAAVRLAAEAEAEEQELEESDAATATGTGDGLSRLDVKRKGNVKLVASRDDTARALSMDPPLPPSSDTTSGPVIAVGPPTSTPAAANRPAPSASAAPKLAPPPEAGPGAKAPVTPASPVGPAPAGHQRPGAEPPVPDYYPKQPLSKPAAGAAPPPPNHQPSATKPPPLPARNALTTPAGAPSREGTPNLPAHTPRFLTRSEREQRTPHSFQRAFGLGFLVAALLAVVSTFAFRDNVAGLLSPDDAKVAVATKPAAAPETLTTLSGILAVPEVSTQGEEAGSVDLAEALKRADKHLAGSTDGDKQEARFWLRRALALGLGDQRLVWALTQLGTIYAAPASGAPDYAAARTLWELAAAQGDPVALCFLASLHEHGLGTDRNEVRALVLYRNAKAHGGCRSIDQSIARLSKGTP